MNIKPPKDNSSEMSKQEYQNQMYTEIVFPLSPSFLLAPDFEVTMIASTTKSIKAEVILGALITGHKWLNYRTAFDAKGLVHTMTIILCYDSNNKGAPKGIGPTNFFY